MDPNEIIRKRKLLVAFTASDMQTVFVGEAISYSDRPTFIINDHGKQKTWQADLAREATQEEAVEYWKARALAAEKAGEG